jgi:hypothetical protein
MAHAARRLTEEQRPAARRGAHLRVVEPPAAHPKKSAVAKGTSRSAKARPANIGKSVGKTKAAAPRVSTRAKATRTVSRRAAAPRRPRNAALAAEGLLAGATRALMPERRSDTALVASCRTTFRLFMIGLFAVSAFGMARVTLSAQAAATSVAAMKIKAELRAATEEAESLELDRGALAQPSRIESAAATLQMGRPANVRYIALPKALAVPAAGAAAGREASSTTALHVPDQLKGVLDAAARITANEVQVLLASGSGLGMGR